MIVEYLEGAPTQPGWYFINYGPEQNLKAVFVSKAKDSDGVERMYAQIDIVAMPVDHMNVNAWAGPLWFKKLQAEEPGKPVVEEGK